jgi:hypothetical protein
VQGGIFLNKIAHYRRALWLKPGGPTLESVLKLALRQCPTPASTKFEYKSDSDAHIADRSRVGTGIFLTVYKEGRPAGTIESGGRTVRRRRAPKGEEFLRTGIYLTVVGNHVGYVADGHTNDGQITGLLHKFLEHAGRPDHETQFALHARGDRKQIRKLLKAGVKSVDLGLSAFLTTVKDANSDGGSSPFADAFGSVWKAIKAVGAASPNAAELDALSEIEATVHLGYDGRTANQLVPQMLSKIAAGVATSTDEFRILTRDGNLITRTDLVIKREVSIAGDEVALDTASAFSILSGVMKEWKAAGVFDY